MKLKVVFTWTSMVFTRIFCMYCQNTRMRRSSPCCEDMWHRTSVYLFGFGEKTTDSITDIFKFGRIVAAEDEVVVKYFQEISRGVNWDVKHSKCLSQPALFRATHIFQKKTATASLINTPLSSSNRSRLSALNSAVSC